MLAQPIAIKQASLCNQTVRHLTDAILNREVLTGQFLPPEAALCKQFNVSRSTVREAITVLETRGLVRRQHGVGILVTDGSQAAAVSSLGLLLQTRKTTLRDLLEARIGLECLIAALAAGHATDAEIGAMEEAIAPMRHPAPPRTSTCRRTLPSTCGWRRRPTTPCMWCSWTPCANCCWRVSGPPIGSTGTPTDACATTRRSSTRCVSATRTPPMPRCAITCIAPRRCCGSSA